MSELLGVDLGLALTSNNEDAWILDHNNDNNLKLVCCYHLLRKTLWLVYNMVWNIDVRNLSRTVAFVSMPSAKLLIIAKRAMESACSVTPPLKLKNFVIILTFLILNIF